MTCANCAATIERTLKRLPTVQNANVNLASERASLEYDPAQLSQEEIVARIQKAGYDVAMGEAVVLIKRLGDASDAQRLEQVLSQEEGVVEAHVNACRSRPRFATCPRWSARLPCAARSPPPALSR